MIRNYLKTAWRALWRQKSYALLNIFGLALGIAGALLILAYVRVDLTWDRHHEHADRLVRVVELQEFGLPTLADIPTTMSPLGPQLQQDLPEVELAVRLSYPQNNIILARGEDHRLQDRIVYADSTLFEAFTFPLRYGDPATALTRPDAIVLSAELARSYFGRENPLGREMTLGGDRPLTVTGVLEPLPYASRFSFRALRPFDAIREDAPGSYNETWGSNWLRTYLRVAPTASLDSLDARITRLYHEHGSWQGLQFWVQPLVDEHLGIRRTSTPGTIKERTGQVVVVATIGVLILLVASINTVNLATARATRRAREVGLRKVVGANRSMMVGQFMGEALLLTLVSAGVAVLLVLLAHPHFESFTGRTMELDLFGGGFFSLALLLVTLVTALLAGLYPALVLARYRPAEVLRSASGSGTGGAWLRRGLVVFQFAVSVILIVGTLTIARQTRYMQSKPLGFDKESVIVLPFVNREAVLAQREDLLDRLERVPGVLAASTASGSPGSMGSSSGVVPEGEEESFICDYFIVDDKTDDVLGLQMAEGEFLGEQHEITDSGMEEGVGSVVVNEAFLEQVGWEEGVGRTLRMWGTELTIVGVARDFHTSGLTRKIAPLVMVHYPEGHYLTMVRFRSEDIALLSEGIRRQWDELFPGTPVELIFLDDSLDRLYRGVIRQGGLLRASSALAIAIACLGLLGLAAYAAERRRKEIAVRKVLGGSVRQLLGLLVREFVLLVLVANVIAWPLAWLLLERWLDEFAYRVPFGWDLLPFAGLIALLIALAVVTAQTLRAVHTNPADVLREE